jgi:predicted dehydrogenase
MFSIGVIGAGGAGANHVRTLAKNRSAHVAVLSDIDGAKAKRVAQQYGVPQWTEAWRDVIKNKDVEAVIIAVPPHLRVQMFLAAAKAGKHILAEKPFGINVEQAREMADAAREYGIKAMVNFGTRNLPTFRKVRQLIASGKYGTPQWVWFKYYLVANPKRFIAPGWFWQKKFSGGHLCENAGHAIDFICQIMGEVDTVSGTTAQLNLEHFAKTGTGKPDIENIGVATLRHASGGVTVLANGCNPAGEWGMSFDILTESSIITVSNDRYIRIMQNGKQVYRYTSKVGWDPIPRGANAFVRYLHDRTTVDDSIATPEDGVNALQITAAAYQSASEGRVVEFDEV